MRDHAAGLADKSEGEDGYRDGSAYIKHIASETDRHTDKLNYISSYCKYNFPMNPHVHLLVGWSVGWLVG